MTIKRQWKMFFLFYFKDELFSAAGVVGSLNDLVALVFEFVSNHNAMEVSNKIYVWRLSSDFFLALVSALRKIEN